MKKIKMQFLRNYRSKSGKTTFVYGLTGDKQMLEAYKEKQAEFYREDDLTGMPLYFSTRYVGDNAAMTMTSNGNFVADMSEFDKAASLVSQYGGNLGDKLAERAADNLMSNHRAMATPTADNAPAEPDVKPEAGQQDVPESPEIATNPTDLDL